MLIAIVAVTLAVSDIASIERAYCDHLGYRVVERGQLPAVLAELWNAPGLAGHDFLLMQPASGAQVYLRVVRQPEIDGYSVLRTWGWNANEILVQDPLALREALRGSPFAVIGEPRGLSMNPEVIAMQALGPAGELVYLTRIPEGGSLFNLGSARAFVDRSFIVVAGGPDVDAMRGFYAEALGMPTTGPAPSRISVLAQAWGLPPESQFPLSVVRFPSDFLIELDQYPLGATARPQREGELPPGMALVSFSVASLDGVRAPFLAGPRVVVPAPYAGRRAALIRGAAGELIELIEERGP